MPLVDAQGYALRLVADDEAHRGGEQRHGRHEDPSSTEGSQEVRVVRGVQGDDDGDAEGTADLSGHAEDGAACCRSIRGKCAGGREKGGLGQPSAGATEQQPW